LAYRNENYVNVFPTVQARYNFSPNFLVRATYSTGISRPGFEQNTTASSYDGDVTITTGNPNLKPTTGDNFDLSFDYYLPKGGILQFGLFDKEFKNYIVTDERSQLYTDLTLGIDNEQIFFATFSNISYAYARGGEAAYHQQFTSLPGPFSGLGVEGNLTLVDSRIQEYSAAEDSLGHAEYGLLPGTSRTTWNLAGFYEKYGFEARIASEFVSRELFTLSGFAASPSGGASVDKAFDTIQDDRLSVDYTMSYRFTPNWKVYFQAKNLTNAPLRFFVDKPSLPIQREFYEQTFLFGIKSHF
jgi:TonB-dependent receptor